MEQNIMPAATSASSTEHKLTRDDQLQLENFLLKVENLRLQRKQLEADFHQSTRLLEQLQVEHTAFVARLNEKYGVELARCAIQHDGTIVPPTQAARGDG